jgi:hypothetical protein
LFFFGHASYAFTRNRNKGRKRVWVASILGLPVGVYCIWVLLRTRPGTNDPPPEKKTALVAAGGIAIFMLFSAGTGMFTNHRIRRVGLDKVNPLERRGTASAIAGKGRRSKMRPVITAERRS